MNNEITFNEKSEFLYYKTPATDWNEALPVGNGRLGGMVFGGIASETIQLNEDSIWSGKKRDRINPSAYPNLQKMRELVFAGRTKEAEELVNSCFCGVPVNQRHYMPLGNLTLDFPFLEEEAKSYRRSIDLSRAVCLTEFEIDGINYKREVIASNPAQVILLRISADKRSAVNLTVRIDDYRDDYYDKNCTLDDHTIFYSGGMGGIDFSAAVMVKNIGGSASRVGGSLRLCDCNEVIIAISCHTSYRTNDHAEAAINDVKAALSKDYAQLLSEHIEDYRSLYARCELVIEGEEEIALLPTNERLELTKQGKLDNNLAALYFNFGRYLMISGSRAGSLPLNLQGIWNKDMWPAWGCKYTVNINTEMNYWPAEMWGLGELVTPLFELIERMRPDGRVTAKEMYGCGGFVCHHNTDLWGDTAPQDLWTPATQWPMGAAWLCLHIWEHYLFTSDRSFLENKYETLKESAQFFVDFLVENGNGELVTCPSVSPENTYINAEGNEGCICAGPSMDSQIIWQLFTAVIDSGRILGRDEEFCQKLITLRDKLPQPQVGKYGQIMEWAEDYGEKEPGHRHISQLFALYPADIISKRHTPTLAEAARSTLERRLSYGGGHTGWSRAWIINHWARLWDGEKLHENVLALLSHSTSVNLFDMHPPFQIDGNFGGAAGIGEALLQSHSGELSVLPAKPKAWNFGSFTNLYARSGFKVSAKWADNSLTELNIYSQLTTTCKLVEIGFKVKKIVCEEAEIPFTNVEDCVKFKTNKGCNYKICI